MAAFIRFESTCFSEHLKVAVAFFINQQCYFFLEIFSFKESPKETRTYSHFHDERKFHHCFSSCFHRYFLRRHS